MFAPTGWKDAIPCNVTVVWRRHAAAASLARRPLSYLFTASPPPDRPGPTATMMGQSPRKQARQLGIWSPCAARASRDRPEGAVSVRGPSTGQPTPRRAGGRDVRERRLIRLVRVPVR